MINFQDHALLLNESYRSWFGAYLVDEPDPGEVLSVLNEFDSVVFSCGLEQNPEFNYGNVKALTLLGCEQEQMLQTSLEAVQQDGEPKWLQQVLAELEHEGSVSTLSGSLLNLKGKLCKIESGKAWQLKDVLGRLHGFGFCISVWQPLA